MVPLIAIVVSIAAPLIMLYLLQEKIALSWLYLFPTISIAAFGVAMLQQLFTVKARVLAGDFGGIEDTITAAIAISIFLLAFVLLLNFFAIWGLCTGKASGKRKEGEEKKDPEAASEEMAAVSEETAGISEEAVPAEPAPVKDVPGTAQRLSLPKRDAAAAEPAPVKPVEQPPVIDEEDDDEIEIVRDFPLVMMLRIMQQERAKKKRREEREKARQAQQENENK